jgi:hypothetical protein
VLTPVVKGFVTGMSLECTSEAIQIHGGHGYVRETGVEQFFRDARITMIYEGANGIQAMDLLGRKVRMNGGAGFELLLATIRRDIAKYGELKATAPYAAQLARALDDVAAATRQLQAAAAGNERVYTANATLYLDMLGHVAIAWMWLRQAGVAAMALEQGARAADTAFYEGKLVACRYFYAYELTRLAHWLPLIASAEALPVDADPAVL